MEMCFLRLAYGTIFGFTMPLSYVITSEIILAEFRGRIAMILAIIYTFGKIYFVFLCYIFLEDY
jgi:MFS family permease